MGRPPTADAPQTAAEVLESITDAFFALDRDWRFTYLNSAAERLLQRTRADLLGGSIWEEFPATFGSPFEAEYRRAAADRVTVQFEAYYPPPLDAWYAVRAYPTPTGLAVYFQDDTGRRRAEAEWRRQADLLRASEERYRTLFESMDERYCIIEVLFDPPGSGTAVDYRFIEVNPAFEAQAGMRDVTGRRMREFVPAIEDHWLANYGRVARTGEPVRFANEYTGLNRWFEVYAFRVGPPGGNRVADLFTDITARKRAERGQEELLARLREADRRKDEFLATLAHELRNPLAPLRSGLQVLRLAGADDRMAADARAMMERQLGQLVHLVDDLLDLSRISRGKIELRKERVELARVVQQAVETSRPAVEQAGHTFAVTLPPHPIHVDADVTRLAQVFSNLLNNAAKYTDRGGRVQLAVRREGGEAVVSVTDTGVGIPAAMLPRVFDMFTQVDRHLERAQGGLGIGLSIVKRLVEMHGGAVAAHSDGQGAGSEFTVRLPVVMSVAAGREAEATVGSGNGVRRRILVVDDNRDSAVSLAMMLTLMGNDTRTAHDGLEALEAAPAFGPDVILLDIGMPRLNGYDAARRIREQPWGRGVVLVALTGWGQDEDRRKSQEAGFDLHLTKPVEPARLEQLLAELRAGTP